METINYTREEAKFMEEKSLSVLNSTHNLNLKLENVEIKFNRLEGISNKIFDVEVKTSEGQVYDLFFKLFGKISSKYKKILIKNY